MVERKGDENLVEEVKRKPLYGVGYGGEINGRIRMEIIVWWSTWEGYNFNENVKWRPLSGGAQGGEIKI